MSLSSRLLAMSGLVMVLAGCGVKGQPLPPIVLRPARTNDLVAQQEGRRAVLRWSYPETTTSGAALPALEALEIWRVELPLAQEPLGTSPRDRTLQVQLIESQGERIAELDPAAIEAATRGPAMEYRDDLRPWFAARSELGDAVLWYVVRSVCCRGRASDYSAISRLVPVAPPAPPAGLTLETSLQGIFVRWDEAPEGAGVLVERSADGVRWTTLTPEPVAGGEWRDLSAPHGQTSVYRLRAVENLAEGGRVIGVPGDPKSVEYPDVYPPEPPVELICLPEGERVRLRWREARDAEHYRVFRRRNDGSWSPLSLDHRSLEFIDSDPPVGNLSYGVRSVDAAGNPSEAAICDTVIGALP
jgi:hypothetical protein